jgi:hypothetical protein
MPPSPSASSQDERRGKKPQLQRRRANRSQRSGINASKLDKRQAECDGGDTAGDDQPAWRESTPPRQDHGATQPADCEQRHPKQLTDPAAVAVQRLTFGHLNWLGQDRTQLMTAEFRAMVAELI